VRSNQARRQPARPENYFHGFVAWTFSLAEKLRQNNTKVLLPESSIKNLRGRWRRVVLRGIGIGALSLCPRVAKEVDSQGEKEAHLWA
jgi:hypothetical protein